jgi:hypothetical protein
VFGVVSFEGTLSKFLAFLILDFQCCATRIKTPVTDFTVGYTTECKNPKFRVKRSGTKQKNDASSEYKFLQRNFSSQSSMLCLRSEDAFVITCVANLMEVKVLYLQQDLRYEISSYTGVSMFNNFIPTSAEQETYLLHLH